MNVFQKREISLRYWLQGREFYKALDALEFAKRYHTGVRKDKITPEIDHQISIAHYIRTLPTLMYPEETIIAVLCHDVREDYNIPDNMIRAEFGALVADAVWCVTKLWAGEKRDETKLFQDMAQNPIASIVKGGDRGHNQKTMVGVFSQKKLGVYLEETEALILPMLKSARRNFPKQEAAYENIKHLLTTQCDMVRYIVNGQPSAQ